MKSFVALALFAVLACASAGLIAGPTVLRTGLVSPIAYASPVAYAAPIHAVHAPIAYASPAVVHTRTFHGNAHPIVYSAHPTLVKTHHTVLV